MQYYDVCLICAKAEELRVVIQTFEKTWKLVPSERMSHRRFEIPAASGGNLSVLMNTCAGMGHVHAAVRTAQIISQYQPGVLMFVGTAASLKPQKVQIGDVIIPRQAISRAYDKISEKGQPEYDDLAKDANFKEMFFNNNALIPDLQTVTTSADAGNIIAGVDTATVPMGTISGGEITLGEHKYALRNPKVHDDYDILSCGMVVDSVSYRDFLAGIAGQNMRKVAAIDMESFGFFKAIESTRFTDVGSDCDGIMIRGISDYAGRKRQGEDLPDGLKELAMRNAAAVAQRFIESLATITERPPRAQPPA